ncbi:DUF488 domain-containing protein [soil metagenome]
MALGIQIKRIYEDPDDADGYRILVDRLWPRRVKKETAMLDEWNKDIAPSVELRKWFDHKENRFAEFAKLYSEELRLHAKELSRIRKLSKTKKVSLLYGAKNPGINHAVVLLNVLTHQ